MKKTIGALALALGIALSAQAASAQDHARMEGPHAPLMHRQEIGLSADQVSRLEAIQARMVAAHKEHCEGARGTTAEQRRAHHEQMRTQMQGFHQQAAAVLTAEQRTRLDALHAAHHGAGGHHAGMTHASHAPAGQQGHARHGAHAQHAQGQHAQHHAQAGQHAQGQHGQHHAQAGQHAQGQHGQHHAQAGQHGEHCGGADCCACCGEGCCKDGKCEDAACEACCKEMDCCGDHAGHSRK